MAEWPTNSRFFFFNSVADFTTALGSQPVTIRAGTAGSQVRIAIQDDTLVEDVESFNLLLFNPSPIGFISEGSATGFISDNDSTSSGCSQTRTCQVT